MLGFVEAFGLGDLPRVAEPLSREVGVAWLGASLSLVAAAILFLRAPRIWWRLGLGAVLFSQTLILSSWSDAKFGTVANLVVLAGVLYGFASQGPLSFRARYRGRLKEHLAPQPVPPPVREEDLSPLPEPVRRYLRLAGAVGRPRVQHFQARWRGRIRARPDAPWMPFTAEQFNVVGERSRFFLMDARRGGLPVDVFHEFRQGSASMQVRLLSLVPLVDARGAEMDRAETVTLFNDLCLLAPGGLLDPAIRWETLDDGRARAHFTVGSNTIRADLHFNEAGELVDFVSDDRLAASPDGKTFVRQRWSTPAWDYRSFGPHRALGRGEGRWHLPEGAFAYVELELLDLAINSPIPT
jgi:hypothetical protein